MEPDTFVGRAEVMVSLEEAWQAVVEGAARVVDIQGEAGSGRRTLVSRLLSRTDAQPLPIRVDFLEADDGFKALLRVYGALYGALHDDASLQASVKDHLEAARKSAKEPVRTWLDAFLAGMDNPKPDTASHQFQVTVPRHSPYLALYEVLASLTSRHPILLDLGEVDNVVSYTFWAFLAAVVARAAREDLPVMVVLRHRPGVEPEVKPQPYVARSSFLDNLPDEAPATRIRLEPLTSTDFAEILAARYTPNRFPPALATWLHERCQGSPGLLDEWLTLLEDRDVLLEADDDTWIVGQELEEPDWAEWLPSVPEEQEALARQVLQAAAMEGRTFTASIIADHLEVDKDTVDDLLDELEEIVREVVYHESAQSWLYAFRSTLLHRFYRESLGPAARSELARSLAELVEKRYAGRSVEYACKAGRLWLDAGEPKRYWSLLGLALSADRADILLMGAEIIKKEPARYPVALYKGVYLTLFEKTAGTAPVDTLLEMLNDVQAWAEDREDLEIVPWLALYRARVAQRTGDLGEARRLAAEARTGFARQRNVVKEAEALIAMALIAQMAGDASAAVEHASRALKKTQFPPVRAQALFVLGVQYKLRGEIQRAVDTLREVLDLSARTSQMSLHLDAGINIAECLLMGGRAPDAVNLLKQLVGVAEQAKQPARRHGALSLLAKAHAAQQDVTKAVEQATAALKLARELKSRQLEALDLLDLGIFSLIRSQFDEALVYLREGEKIARASKEGRLLQETLFHLAMATTSVRDYDRALDIYQEVLKLTRERKDLRREGNTLFNIAGIYLHKEEFARARDFLRKASPLIKKKGTAEEKQALRQAQEKLELKFN